MLRRPGYVIAPHRDPKWGFVTGLVYLASAGDNESSARSSIGCAATKRRPTTSRTTWTSRGATWCGPCRSRPIRCWLSSIPPARTARPFLRTPSPPTWSGMFTSSGSGRPEGHPAVARADERRSVASVGRRQGAQGRSPLTLSTTLAQLEAPDHSRLQLLSYRTRVMPRTCLTSITGAHIRLSRSTPKRLRRGERFETRDADTITHPCGAKPEDNVTRTVRIGLSATVLLLLSVSTALAQATIGGVVRRSFRAIRQA